MENNLRHRIIKVLIPKELTPLLEQWTKNTGIIIEKINFEACSLRSHYLHFIQIYDQNMTICRNTRRLRDLKSSINNLFHPILKKYEFKEIIFSTSYQQQKYEIVMEIKYHGV